MSKILVVDDDLVMQKLLSRLINERGHQVEIANDGIVGLDKFYNYKPDVIISDVLMPEMDGYEFCSRIRELPDGRQIPFLMLTSLDSVEQKIKGFEAGADDYIVKPFDPLEFMARLDSMIKRSEVTKENLVGKNVGGKTIGVFSLRGGVGVSTIATNVAVGLSQVWGYPTCLVDMVLTGGQTALYLNLPLKNTWAEIAQFPIEEIDSYLIQSTLMPHDSGVYMLPSPRRPEMAELVTQDKVTRVINILKDTTEYVVFDLPHDFNLTTLTVLDQADVILVVLSPEIVSIRSAVMVLEIFEDLGYDREKIHLILNWTFSRKGITAIDIENSLKKKIDFVLPFASEEFIHALNLGSPPTYETPEKPLGMLFEDLALALAKGEHRKVKPINPSEAWQRAVRRFKKRKSDKDNKAN